MNGKLYQVLVEYIDNSADEPYENLETLYVIGEDFNDAAEKAEKSLLSKKFDKTGKPILTEDGSLNPIFLNKVEDNFKIKTIEIQLLTETIIT